MGFDSSVELIAVRAADTPTDTSGAWVHAPSTVSVAAGKPLVVRACDLDDFEVVLLAPRLAG